VNAYVTDVAEATVSDGTCFLFDSLAVGNHEELPCSTQACA
jgi:hypothetical protein